MLKIRTILALVVFIIIASLIFRLDNIYVLDRFLTILSIVTILLIPVLVKFEKASLRFLLPMVIVYIYLICNTYIHNIVDNKSILIVFIIKSAAIVYALGRYVANKQQDALVIITNVYIVLLVANFIQLTLFPGILGEDDGNELFLVANNYNSFGGIFAPGIIASYGLKKYDSKYGKLFWFVTILSFVSVLWVGSLTSIMGFGIILLYACFEKIHFVQKYAPFILLIFIIFFFSSVVVGGETMFATSEVISTFLSGANKELTFSGRTLIWLKGIQQFLQAPLYGIGYYQLSDYAALSLGAKHVHNIMLDVLLSGGIVYLSIIIIFVCFLYRRLFVFMNQSCKRGVLFISLSYMLMMQFEVYNYCMITLFFYVIYQITCIDKFKTNKV